jgi:hypothetical protein
MVVIPNREAVRNRLRRVPELFRGRTVYAAEVLSAVWVRMTDRESKGGLRRA